MKVCPTCTRRYPDNALRCPEDGTPLIELTSATPAALPDNLVGRRMFGEYVVVGKLGEGGMGAVYLAKHRSIDQSIAIKVLHGTAAENSELLQRFNREAKAIARLTHPNIIRVFIFGRTEDGLVYLAMEFVQGISLRELIEREGRLSPRASIYLLKQVLGALAEAHDLGIIHRDLKPDNILITSYRGNPRFVKVVDFGIAKVKEPDGTPEVQLTQAGVVYGTPEYLSPEQAQAKSLDGRSDLYACGIILWEMLTGDVPFKAKTAMAVLVQHVYDAPPDPRRINPGIPVSLAQVVLKALEKDPSQRFQTAAQFLEALEQIERELVKVPVSQGDVEEGVAKTTFWVPPSGFFETPNPPGAPAGPPAPNPYPLAQPGSASLAQTSSARRLALIALVAGVVLLLAMAIILVLVLSKH